MNRRGGHYDPFSGWQKKVVVGSRKTGAERTQAYQLTGWNFTAVANDDNDIVSWMKREKNGANKRKINKGESFSEEQFRHVFDLCSAIENKHLFERQILYCDRYPRTCQYGPPDKRVSTVTPLGSKPADHVPIQPGGNDSQSAIPVAHGGLTTDDKTESAVCEGQEVEGRTVAFSGERTPREIRQRVTCASPGTLPGSTLAHAHAVPTKNKVAKDDDHEGHDDGYGSKGSSNDNEDEGVEEGSLETDYIIDNTPTEDGRVPTTAMTIMSQKEPAPGACSQQQGCCSQELPHQQQHHQRGQLDSTAKIRYSRAEETVYERVGGQRSRGRGLEYPDVDVDSAVSRPSTFTQVPNHQRQPVGVTSHQQHQLSAGLGPAMPRIMVLRKITIQDSAQEAFAQDPPPSKSHVPRVHKGHSHDTRLLQQRRPLQARSAPDVLTSQSGQRTAPQEDSNASGPLTTSPRDSAILASEPPQPSSSKGRSQMLSSSFGGCGGDGGGAGCSWYSDKMSHSLPVTDLLPAVEHKIRRTRAAHREVTVDNLSISQLQTQWQHQHQQQLPQQLPPWQYDLETRVSVEASDPENGRGYGSGKTSVKCHSRVLALDDSRAGASTDSHSLGTETVPSLPSFRPHYSVSPLQRAREIAHRRLHGYLTQQPDGSETMTVSSPRYTAQVDHKYNASRTRSACRLLGQVLSRQPLESNYS